MEDRLIHFFNHHLLDAVKKEASNVDKMHLYYLNGNWSAFEHSAYALQKLFPKAADKMVINHREYPFPIINVGVSEEVMKTYLQQHIACRQREDYMEFKVMPYNAKEYHKWYRDEVRD